uniref:(northern house mosquito) hypothetical protein n=1 Tax=Culex pipiens TaxID=7175 RepID=A0A8D8KCV6_CULPI
MAEEDKASRNDEVWKRVKTYIPFLQELISFYKNDNQQNRQQQLQKLTTMYDLLTNKRLNYGSLCKCEGVLIKLYETNPLKKKDATDEAPKDSASTESESPEEPAAETSSADIPTPASPVPDTPAEPDPEPELTEAVADSRDHIVSSNDRTKSPDRATEKPPLTLDEIQRLIIEKPNTKVRAAINDTLKSLKRIPPVPFDHNHGNPNIPFPPASHMMPPSPVDVSPTSSYWQTENDSYEHFPHPATNSFRPTVSRNSNIIELTPGPSELSPLYRRRENLPTDDVRMTNDRMDISPLYTPPQTVPPPVPVHPPMIKDPRLRKAAAISTGMPLPDQAPPDPVNRFHLPPNTHDPRVARPLPPAPPPPNELPKCIAPNPNLPLEFPKRRLSICANQVIVEEIPPEPVLQPVTGFPARRMSVGVERLPAPPPPPPSQYDQPFHGPPFVPPPVQPSLPIFPVSAQPHPMMIPPLPMDGPSVVDRDPRRKHQHGGDFRGPPSHPQQHVTGRLDHLVPGPNRTPSTYAEYRRQKEMREKHISDKGKEIRKPDVDKSKPVEDPSLSIGMVPNNNRVAAKAYAKPGKPSNHKERHFAPQAKDHVKHDAKSSFKPYKHNSPASGSSSSSSHKPEKKQHPSEKKDKSVSGSKGRDLFGEQLSSFDKMYRSGDFSKKSSSPATGIGGFKIPKIKRVEPPAPPKIVEEKEEKTVGKSRPNVNKEKSKSPEPPKGSIEDDDLWDADELPKQAAPKEGKKKGPKKQPKPAAASLCTDDDMWDNDPVPSIEPAEPSPPAEESNVDSDKPEFQIPTIVPSATKEKPVFQMPAIPAARRIMTRRNSVAISQMHGDEVRKPVVALPTSVPARITRRRASIAVSQDDIERNSANTPPPAAPTADADDEVVVRKLRKNRKRIVVIDDDDEDEKPVTTDEGETTVSSAQIATKPTEEAASENVVSSTTSESQGKKPKKKPGRKPRVALADEDHTTSDDTTAEQTDLKDENTKIPDEESTKCTDEDKKENKDGIESLLSNSTPDNKAQLLAMLSTMLDEKKLKKIQEIIESPSDKTIQNEQDQKPDDGEAEGSRERTTSASISSTNEACEKEKNAAAVKKKRKATELDKLNENIAECYDRDEILKATGRRSCTRRSIPVTEDVVKPPATKRSVVDLTQPKEKAEPKLRNLKVVVQKLDMTMINGRARKFTEESVDDDHVSIASSSASVSPKSKKKRRNVWATGVVSKKKKKTEAKPQQTASSPMKTYAPKPVTKNTLRELHCKSDKSKDCALCSYTGQISSMVQHYVRYHPLHEVYLSRIPNPTANKIKKDPMKVTGNICEQNITFECIFCKEVLTKTRYNWKLHLASHTGEYRYKCTNCTIKSLTPCTYSHDSECSGSSMEVVNELVFEENHIHAYLCRLCNFVQLSPDNMKTHLKEEHDRQRCTGMLQFSALNFEPDMSAEASKSNETLDSDISMPELTPQITTNKQSDMSAFIPSVSEEIDSLQVLTDRSFVSPPKPSIVDRLRKNLDEMMRSKTTPNDDDEWEDIESPTKEDSAKAKALQAAATKARRSLAESDNVPMPSPLEVKEEQVDVFERKEVVSNIGFCKVADKTWYLCVIGDCKYANTNRTEMYAHVNQHGNIVWDGFCRLCTAQVIDEDSCELSKEVKHMAVVHIKDRSAIDDLNVAPPALCPVPVPMEERPVLKLRRFSGDKLSLAEEAAAEEKPINLKPWLEMATVKERVHCLNMLEPKSLYCFYKCMAVSCCFTSPVDSMMDKHLDNHELVGDMHGPASRKSWLECSYCDITAESKADLMRHLKMMHGKSAHQCAYCFYRSREAYNVILHQKLVHGQEKNQILVIEADKHPLTAVDQELLNRRRMDNITPLICTVCKSEFCVLDAFMTHLKDVHPDTVNVACQCCQESIQKQKMPRHLLTHRIGIYECIYCKFGTDTMEAIQVHVCNQHPMEPFYCCVRYNKTPGKIMEATLKSLYEKALEESVFVPCSYTKEELSYKSVDTKSNHDICYTGVAKPTVIPLQLPPIRVGDSNILLSAQIPSALSSSSSVGVSQQPKQTFVVNRTEVIKVPMIASVSGGGIMLPCTTSVPIISAVQGNYQEHAPAPSQSMPIITQVRGGAAAAATSSVPIISRVEGGCTAMAVVRPASSLLPQEDEALMLEAERIAIEMIKDTGLPKAHLYKCIFKGCNAQSADSIGLRKHLTYGHLPSASYTCSHCKKQNQFPNLVTFVQHLKSHETQRVFCFICDYKGSYPPDVIKHVKEVHKFNKPTILFLNPKKNDPNNDIILFAPGQPTEAEKRAYYRKLIDLYNHKMQTALLQQKTHFAPDECETLPKQAIFSQMVSCSTCQYSTKVRINMYRHLKGHLNDMPVSNVDPKNPVPCWGQGEKHFDRMRNPAASSQEDDDLIQSLCFVQETKRYICGAPNCRYLTINEVMLQTHLNALHGDVKEYKCPHCPAVHVFAGQLNATKVLEHLRLHDKELYRCSTCQLFLNNQKDINRHVSDKHPPSANAAVLVIRDGSTAGSAASSADSDVVFKWKCDVCMFKSVTLGEMRSHLQDTHNINAKYRCARCLFSSSLKSAFTRHYEQQHPGVEILIISLYKAIEGDDSRADTTPLWRREVNKTKSIRGIQVEVEEDQEDEDDDEETPANVVIVGTPSTSGKRRSAELAEGAGSLAKRPKQDATPVIKAFKCGFRGCTYVDDFGAGIVSHFKAAHPNEKPSVLRNSLANPEQSRFDYFLKYACHYCIKKADTIQELIQHWKQMHQLAGTRSKDKPFLFRTSKIILCFYCRKGAVMPEMKSHFTAFHSGLQPIYMDFRNPKRCAECDFVMGANRQEMVNHFAQNHKVENEYSKGWIDFLTDDVVNKILRLNSSNYGCEKCPFITDNNADFAAHYTANHPGQAVIFNEYTVPHTITYHCSYNNCKSEIADEKSLAHHILYHVPIFKCLGGEGQCNVQFRTFTMLMQHHQTTHKNEGLRYALKTPEEYKEVLRMITIQFWNGFMMTLEDARQAGNRYASSNGLFKLVNQLCHDSVLAESQALTG